jgi:hypothetical protein
MQRLPMVAFVGGNAMADPAGTTNAFFSLQSMMTLGGATGATFVVCNGIQRAFDYNPRWLALLVAQLLCLGVVYQSGGLASDYVIGVINGFLVYCSAAGATGVASAATGAPPLRDANARSGRVAHEAAPAAEKRRFLSVWF